MQLISPVFDSLGKRQRTDWFKSIWELAERAAEPKWNGPGPDGCDQVQEVLEDVQRL